MCPYHAKQHEGSECASNEPAAETRASVLVTTITEAHSKISATVVRTKYANLVCSTP